MPILRLFASAREAAGTARTEIAAETVAELLDKARAQFGDRFGRVLETSRVWVNGQPAEMATPIAGHDVVAVLPPVSGGSAPTATAAAVAQSEAGGPPAPAEPAAAARPPRRLRLVPPPPPDDVSAAPAPTAPATASMGRLALAPVADPQPTTDVLPSAWPAPEAVPVAPEAVPVAQAAVPITPEAVPAVWPEAVPTVWPEAVPVPPQSVPAVWPEASPAVMPDLPPAPYPSTWPLPGAPLPAPVPAAGAQAAAAAAPATAPVVEPKPAAPLAVVHQANRPHGRLGVAWAVLTLGALLAGPGWLSLWLAVVAFVAASQTAMVWRKRGERPLPGFAAASAAALPLTAATGLDHMNMVVAGAVVLTLVGRMATATKAPGRDVALTLVIGLSIGMAAAGPVLLRSINIPSALFLLTCAAVYDAGAYLVGTGASSAWEGPAAGVAALIPLTMLAAVILVPPFHGGAPLLLGALAMVLAPFGPVAGSALLGDRTAHAPGLRRLDSLLVLGPIWAWCAAALLT